MTVDTTRSERGNYHVSGGKCHEIFLVNFEETTSNT